tara:strand:- start:7718 stop:8056 length:339 start_codon:yes stop_codon:yes gene_type:complete
MGRYAKYKIFTNKSDYYSFLRKERGVKKIRQYETPIMYHPTVSERAALKTTKHVWKYGDRFYQLANEYYNDVTFWWVIAWFNGYPTEGAVRTGAMITIPLNLEEALQTLRAY